MDQIRKSLADMSLDQLADWMSTIQPNTNNDMTARAEFLRRQTLLAQAATAATVKAADAAVETARFTRDNARYLLWSVIVLAVSSAGTFVLALLRH